MVQVIKYGNGWWFRNHNTRKRNDRVVYKPSDYWMICNRCGSKYRKSDMELHWTGVWLCEEFCWEPQHPQDFVTGTTDDVNVPVVRTDVKQVTGETTLNGALTAGATTATLTSVSGLADEDPVGIVLDNDLIHWTFINGDLAGSVITLKSHILTAAADGNTVYLPSLNNESWS